LLIKNKAKYYKLLNVITENKKLEEFHFTNVASQQTQMHNKNGNNLPITCRAQAHTLFGLRLCAVKGWLIP